ncbi:membrane protease YdiL (CAAX protease family) [Bradyrhizobium sp. USDA 3397]
MSAEMLATGSDDGCRPKMTWLARFAIILAIGPFIIKRIILLYDDQEDYVVWLAMDYAVRCVSLLGVMLGFQAGLIERPKFRAGWFVSGVVLAGLLSAELLRQTLVFPILRDNLDYFRLSSMPIITNVYVRWVDLVFGILLVAVSEELVFRRLIFSIFGPRRSLSATLFGALIFALVHLTSGLADTVNAFISGILLGIAFWITRRISVCIVSHYVLDVKIFGGF